jgi:16S rRNA G527 N7-methylase RsmG
MIMFMNKDIFTSHHFDLSREELEKFQKFLSLFMEYNSHTNLSAIRDEEGIIEKHFVDSLYGISVILGLSQNPETNNDSSLAGFLPSQE